MKNIKTKILFWEVTIKNLDLRNHVVIIFKHTHWLGNSNFKFKNKNKTLSPLIKKISKENIQLYRNEFTKD